MFSRPTVWLTPALIFFSAVAAHAHDALQSSTNIWLRPDQMEVELILSRVPARSLVDNPPPVPVTDGDFGSTYHTLFQKSAPTLVDVTLDGKKITPDSITVELYEETDLRFDYIFPRPPNGKLSFTASFIKRMDEGYINSLGVNEGLHMIGMDNQTAERPTWDMDLGPKKIVVTNHAEGTVVDKNFFFNTVAFWAIIFLLVMGAFIWLRRKNRPSPPSA